MSWKNTTAGKEFDLDDPHFTTPMSVISGLASGLCERKAAADLTYSAANWNTTNKKSQTVSRMADNIAITQVVGGTATYGTSAAQFVQPESWGQGTPAEPKTYLDYFDNELMNVANMYVDSGGVAYDGFDGLAVAASARADSDTTVSHYDGYIVGTTATSGGSGVVGDAGRPAYVGNFTPMFRADWAVERRDMLEELIYTKDTETYGRIDVKTQNSFCEASEPDLYQTVNACAVSILGSQGDARQDENVNNYCYTALVDGRYPWNDHFGRTFGILFSGSCSWDGSFEGWGEENNSIYLGGDNSRVTLVRPTGTVADGGGLYLYPTTTVPANVTSAAVVFATGSPVKPANQMIWEGTGKNAYIVSNGITSRVTGYINDRFYDVQSGGSLLLSSGAFVSSILVRDGGYVSMANGAEVSCCSLQSGGIFEGVPNIAELSINGTYALDRPFFNTLERGSKYTMITGETAYYPVSSNGTSDDQNFCVADGGVLIISAAIPELPPGEWVSPDDDQAPNIGGRLLVLPGGTVSINGVRFTRTHVYEDQSVEVITFTKRVQTVEDIAVMPGGMLTVGPYAKLGWEFYGWRDAPSIAVYEDGDFTLDGRYWENDQYIYEAGAKISVSPRAYFKVKLDDINKTMECRVDFHFDPDMPFSAMDTYISVDLYDPDDQETYTEQDIMNTRIFRETNVCCFCDMGLQITGTTNSVQFGPNTITLQSTSTADHYLIARPMHGTAGSFVYNDITLPEPPTDSIIIGKSNVYAVYRVCIESVLTVAGGITSHYPEFVYRKFGDDHK